MITLNNDNETAAAEPIITPRSIPLNVTSMLNEEGIAMKDVDAPDGGKQVDTLASQFFKSMARILEGKYIPDTAATMTFYPTMQVAVSQSPEPIGRQAVFALGHDVLKNSIEYIFLQTLNGLYVLQIALKGETAAITVPGMTPAESMQLFSFAVNTSRMPALGDSKTVTPTSGLVLVQYGDKLILRPTGIFPSLKHHIRN